MGRSRGRARALSGAGKCGSLGPFGTGCPMAQAPRSGGRLPPLATVPPLWAQPEGTGAEHWERRRAGALRGDFRGWPGPPDAGSVPCLDSQPGGAPGEQPRWAAPADAGEHHEAGFADWRWEPAAGRPIPPALRRLRAVLLRLHREREQLLQARNFARHLQAAVRLLRILSRGEPFPGPGPFPQLCRELPPCPSRGAVLRICLREAPDPLLLARPVGIAALRLDAAIEMQLRALGREPASPGLSSQLAHLLLALPAYHQLQGKALSHVPGAARPFSPARVLHLLAGERGCQVAYQLAEALTGSCLRDQLRRRCHEERELLPGLLGLMGGMVGSASSGLGLGGAGALWSQYCTLLWASCARSMDLSLGPWRDPRTAAHHLSQALDQESFLPLASLPQECEKELASLCHNLFHQSLIWSWDQAFCQALGSAHGGQSNLPSSSHTTELLQQLFPPLLDALQEPRSGLLLRWPPGPALLALGLCTLQTTLLWFLSRAQQHVAAWAPGSLLLLIQKDLPPLLHEAEALSSLASEEKLALEVEQQLGLEIQKLTAQMQLLPEETLSLFFKECHKQATQGFELYMPQGRYWRLRLCPGNFSYQRPLPGFQRVIVFGYLQILALLPCLYPCPHLCTPTQKSYSLPPNTPLGAPWIFTASHPVLSFYHSRTAQHS
ncbi:coiled-coil domain-containing protein 142 isoform X2 [Manis pentadactyla]|uniref:coiled-coil domain-containing protein 142 isoform X2 n=1 Tax=Manis pentadactyla TaxID=143292 RepID=UPI00255CA1C0|nr:coiled-coil domain-containing protein 142 isoform X2 [Manis pentadactyla]